MRKIYALRFVITLVYGFTLNVHSELLFNGGAPDGSHGLRVSDIGFVVSAADFETAEEWNVTSAEFWSHEISSMFEWDGTVSYLLFEDDAGSPADTPVYSGLAQSIIKTLDPAVNTSYSGYKYSFNFESPLELEGAMVYWLALNLGGGDSVDTTQAFWAGTNSSILSDAVLSHGLPYWNEYYFDLAFRLHGTAIPEPASIGLLGLVSGSIYFTRRFFTA